jgi:hypothetical protein
LIILFIPSPVIIAAAAGQRLNQRSIALNSASKHIFGHLRLLAAVLNLIKVLHALSFEASGSFAVSGIFLTVSVGQLLFSFKFSADVHDLADFTGALGFLACGCCFVIFSFPLKFVFLFIIKVLGLSRFLALLFGS